MTITYYGYFYEWTTMCEGVTLYSCIFYGTTLSGVR